MEIDVIEEEPQELNLLLHIMLVYCSVKKHGLYERKNTNFHFYNPVDESTVGINAYVFQKKYRVTFTFLNLVLVIIHA